MSQEGQPSASRDKNRRVRTAENSDEERDKKRRRLDAANNTSALLADATNQAGEVMVVQQKIQQDLTTESGESQKTEEPENKEECAQTPEEENSLDGLELLPTTFDDGVAKTKHVSIPKEWGLDAAYCKIDGEDVYFKDLLKEYGIYPAFFPIVTMDLRAVPWRAAGSTAENLVVSVSSKFPMFITVNGCEERRTLLNEIETETLSVAKEFGVDAISFLPDFASAGSWRTAVQSASLLTTKNFEQDNTVQMLAQYFEPFLEGLEHNACSSMPLPPPFESFNRKPAARAFVKTSLNEFIYFLREDRPVRTDNDADLHKGLFKLVQLMRCALRSQTLMLRPDYGGRTLYCFGILCNGLKLQLLQMSVTLNSPTNYASPIFSLYIEKKQLDLGFTEQTAADVIHSRLTRLFNWLAVIRSYGFHLDQRLNSGEWSLNKEMLNCKASLADSRAKSTAKNDVQNKGEHDHNTNPRRDQNRVGSTQRQLNFDAVAQSKSNTNKNWTTDGINDAILAALVRQIEDNRYSVLHENNSRDMKVVALCTFIGRARVFAVKIFGVEAQKKSREVEVMNMLGKHPHISEILATTTLNYGELIVVQPYYPPYPHKNVCYEKFRKIFLHAAKGLEYMHERGVIHADLKPSNMVFDKDCHTRIIDFDCSLRIGIDGWNEFVGTEGFRAPETEAYDIKSEITPKIDIWSLAMAMCSSLSMIGEEEKDSIKKRELLLKLVSLDEFFAPLRLLLEKMVELNPENRPTARQVCEAIELSMQGKDYAHIL